MLPSAFEGDARVVYEEVANNNIRTTVDELWVLLEARLCNKVHQAALQDRFFNMKLNDAESRLQRSHSDCAQLRLLSPGGSMRTSY